MTAPQPAYRVSAIALPDSYRLPAAPVEAPGDVADAYRQARFLLRDDLRLFERGMQLQLEIIRASSHSSFRTHPYAALAGLWSRAFLALSDTCLLATRGSYASCATLVRAACEYIAAQQQLAGDPTPFIEWLAGSLRADEAHKAVAVGLGRFFSGESLANDARLSAIYRPAGDLARPNFGATLIVAGPESNNRRLALAFGDAAFHLGWAQLILGWLLALCERQLDAIARAGETFAANEPIVEARSLFARDVERALGKSDRCAIEAVDDGERYLVRNFRRAPGGAPKRVLL